MSVEIAYDRSREAVPYDPEEAVTLSEKTWLSRLFGLFFTKKNSLITFVIIPSIAAAAYYFFIASSQYVAETRMIVRTIGVSEQFDTSEKREGRSMIGGDSLTQDSYIVANYLKSPEIVRKLDAQIGLHSYFSKSETDWLSRISADARFEDLYRYWTKHVDTYVDGPSGIIIFTVRAFSPEDSVAISKAALSSATEMVDKLSEKAKRDLVTRVEGDVTGSLGDYRLALDNLREYQNKTGILDPLSSAKMLSAVISKLTEQKLQLLVNLKSLEAAKADDTPRGRELRRSIQAIDDQITIRQNSMAGQTAADGTQLSTSLTEFSNLETHRIVTQAIYEANVRNLDTAKSTALQRTTFLSIFSNAHIPEESEYPDRFSDWIILTVGLLTLWMTATLIWMSIEDHRV
jgi:capsular polysaccharide transport system permease protein